ncbi:hypothetical protein BH11ARM2_BH11ARM2_17280 [soil metagenome]
MIHRMVLGIFFGLTAVMLVMGPLDGHPQPIFSLLVFTATVSVLSGIGLFVAILVHELGHVMAGLGGGMIFVAMLVDGFSLRRKPDGGFRFGRISRAWAGGLVMMDFPPTAEVVPTFRRFIGGGPLASIVWCAFTLFLFSQASVRFAGARDFFEAFPIFVALTLFMMAATLLPGTLWTKPIRGLMPDAYLLLRLRKPGPQSDRLVSLFTLAQRIRAGERARDWPAALIEAQLVLQDGSAEEIQARMLAYYHYMDTGELEQADLNVNRALALLPSKGAESTLVGQSILYASSTRAAEKGDTNTARQYLEKIKKPFDIINGNRWRAWATLHLAEGNPAETLKAVEASRKALHRFTRLLPGDITPDLEKLDHLERKAKALSSDTIDQ